MSMLAIRIDDGPHCPACDCNTFDDWWVGNKTLKSMGGVTQGSIKCHSCGRFFRIEKYSDGEVHSTMNRKVNPNTGA